MRKKIELLVSFSSMKEAKSSFTNSRVSLIQFILVCSTSQKETKLSFNKSLMKSTKKLFTLAFSSFNLFLNVKSSDEVRRIVFRVSTISLANFRLDSSCNKISDKQQYTSSQFINTQSCLK